MELRTQFLGKEVMFLAIQEASECVDVVDGVSGSIEAQFFGSGDKHRAKKFTI